MTRKPIRYYELRWGDPPPFNGCDWLDPICTLLLGVHYGYREEANAEQFERYQQCRQKGPAPMADRRTILAIIEAVRHPE